MTMMMMGGGSGYGGLGGMARGSLSPSGPSMSGGLASPQPPLSPASNESPTSPVSPGRHGGSKACGVCGDVAKSMHFGGLSCDSCKAFFRRSVQNSAYKGFTCPYEKKCVIAVSSRKACQYCRFHKCLAIGMEKGWVMTEDERRKMMQQRQEKKTKQESHRQGDARDVDKYSLSDQDSIEIKRIVSLYQRAYQVIPYQDANSPGIDGAASVMSPWMTFCKRIGFYFSLFSEFSELPGQDQGILLKTAITSACIIMGSVVYDSSSGQWPGKSLHRPGFIPQISSSNVSKLVPAELMSRVEVFFKKFQQICPDETMAMILILVTLFSPELMGLQEREQIQDFQEKYTHILHQYMRWKYKEKSHLMFPKVLVSLADIRELAERTYQMRIQQGAAVGLGGLGLSSLSKAASAAPPATVPMETCQTDGAHDQLSVLVKEEFEEHEEKVQQHPRSKRRHGGDSLESLSHRIPQKVMDQIHNSAVHLRAPQLLPFIIQIVKKIGAENSAGMLTGQSEALPQVKQQKLERKRRTVEIKQEKIDDDTTPQLSQEFPCTDARDHMAMNMHSGKSDFNCNKRHAAPGMHHHHHPQFAVSPPQFTSGGLYPASPMDSMDSCDMPPQSPFEDPSGVSAMLSSPHNELCSAPSPHMAPVAPYTPPSVLAPSPMPVQQPMFPVADMPLSSPMAAPSPYSDTLSSSPPESFQSPLSDVFASDLTEVEMDVITQLLDYVCNNSNLDNLGSLKEIIPQHLLAELKSKLS